MYCTQVTDRKQFKEPKSCQKRDKFCIQRNSLLCSIAAKSQFVEPNVPVLASAGSQKKAAIAMEQEGAAPVKSFLCINLDFEQSSDVADVEIFILVYHESSYNAKLFSSEFWVTKSTGRL